MTHRERMLAALRGEPSDRLPWIPRLDLWYSAAMFSACQVFGEVNVFAAVYIVNGNVSIAKFQSRFD